KLKSLSRRSSNASCVSRDGARSRILATFSTYRAPVEEMFGLIFRAESRIGLFSVCFPASLLLFSFASPKQACAPPHLGGIGADSCDLDVYSLGDGNIRPMEIFPLDVSRAGSPGG